jgi:hypothetical protein
MLKGFFFGLRDQAPNALGAILELLLNFISAAQRSKAFCIQSQLSGVPLRIPAIVTTQFDRS